MIEIMKCFLRLFDTFFVFQEQLAAHDFTKFNALKPRLLETVDKMLAEDIARLMAMIPQEEALATRENNSTVKGMLLLCITTSYSFYFKNFQKFI